MAWVLIGGIIVIVTGAVTLFALMKAADRADQAAAFQYELLCAQQREERRRRAERMTMRTVCAEEASPVEESPVEAYLRRQEAEEEAERAEAELVEA